MRYPDKLKNAVAKINVSCNEFKLIANRDNIVSSSILTVPLPNNGLCDVKSFYLSALMTTTTTAGNALPAKWLPLFQRVIVEIGSQTLNSCQYLPEIMTALNQVASTAEQRARKNVYGYGNGLVVGTSNATNAQIIIDEFPGTFLDSSSSQIIDMSLLPDVKLHFYTNAPATALVKSATGAGADYTLAGVYGSIKTYAIQDGGNYYQEVDNHLKSGDTVDITWTNYMTTLNNQGVNSTTCLDVQSSSVAGAFVLPLVGPGVLSETNTTSLTSSAFSRAVPADLRWQFALNGISQPLAQSSVADAFAITTNSFGHKYNKTGSIESLCANQDAWRLVYFVAGVSFSLPADFKSGKDTHWNSGYNTMDSCSKLSVTLSGTQSAGMATQVLLVVATNPILRIGANKSFVIVP